MRDYKLYLLAALCVAALLLNAGCSLHVQEMPTVTITGPKDVDIHWGKPADIFAAGRADAQRQRYVPQELIDDLKLNDVHP